MKVALVLAYMANVILGVVGLLILPDQVASRFGAGGVPNDWMSPATNFFIMFGLYTFILALFLGMPWLMWKLPAKLINLPDKDYWLRDENWLSFKVSFSRSCMQYGFAALMFFFCIGVLALDANLSDPLRLGMVPFWVAFWAFMGYTALWVALLMRSLALPHQAAASEL